MQLALYYLYNLLLFLIILLTLFLKNHIIIANNVFSIEYMYLFGICILKGG